MCFHHETEREKLERAIKRLEAREWCDDAKLALAAARRHLDTLPKPKRKVRVACRAIVIKGTSQVVSVLGMGDVWSTPSSREVLVELTGEYEE